jgi:hypothetical protein
MGGSLSGSPTLTTVSGSTVNYTGSAAQTIYPITYNGNLGLSGAGTKTIATSATVAVAENLVNSSTLVISAGTTATATWLRMGGNVTNNVGATINSTASNTRFIFISSNAQTFTNNGTVTAPVASFDIANTNASGLTLAGSNSIVITRANLFYGTIFNTSLLTLGTGGTSSVTVQRGVVGATNPVGSFNSAPTYNIGSGGITLIYDNGSVAYSTGYEVPASNTINSMAIYDAPDITLNSNLTILSGLTFAGGTGTPTFRIGANLLTINGAITYTATPNIYGGASSNLTLNSQNTLIAVANGLNNFTVNANTTLTGAVTVSGTLTLLNGFLNSSSWLTMATGSTISRSLGYLNFAPTFAGTVNLVYTGSAPITTGLEMPTAIGVLNNLTTNTGGVTQGGTPSSPVNILTYAFSNLTGWIGNIGTGNNQFSSSATSNAGGTANECMYLYGISSTTIYSASIYRLVNTTGYSSLNISWKQFLNNYDATTYPYTINVQCATSAGGPWTDIYTLSPTGTSNIGPETIMLNNWVTNVGGDFYIRYYITGYTYGMNYWYFDDLVIEGQTSVASTVTVNGTLDVSNGNYSISSNSLVLNGDILGSNSIVGSSASNIAVGGSGSNLVIPSITDGLKNFTISRATGVTMNTDLTVIGVLNMPLANPSATMGSLNMWDGTNVTTLTMGANATTIGLGDVTGVVKRTTFVPNISYTFGNQKTSAIFPDWGTLPTEISMKIRIGAELAWRPSAIKREIEIIQTGGSGTKAVCTFFYLDSELNGNVEEDLVLWTKYFGLEYGRSAYNTTENWVAITNVNVGFFSSSFDETKNFTLDEHSDVSTLTWNGSVSDSWTTAENWTPNAGPSSDKSIIIPNATTTPNDPILPSFTEIKSLRMEANAILNSGLDAELTINGSGGAWSNFGGTFNHSSSNVIFTNADATMSGTTNFYNVTIVDAGGLIPASDNIMRIANALTLEGTGVLRAAFLNNTIEYNGANQTVINPNGLTPGYYNLILSGSGTKTMPITALSILDNLSLSGSASVTAAADITVGGNATFGLGTTFNLGSYNHSFAGNITNNGGTIAPATSTLTLNGSVQQTITSSGGIDFYNLVITNTTTDITLGSSTNCSIGGNLTINTGSVFDLVANNLTAITGSVTNSGTIKTQSTSAAPVPVGKTWGGYFEYTGTGAQTIVAGTYNNLAFSGIGGATAAANIMVDGILNLLSANPSSTKGILDMGSNTLLMGSLATTTGQGDVTGIVRRTTILPNTTYSLGNQYTTVYFPEVGTLPSEISLKISIGTAPAWRAGAVNRIYDLIQTGGNSTEALLQAHYLDSELNGNIENTIVGWLWNAPSTIIELGKSSSNSTANWVLISNINIGSFSSSFGVNEIALDESATLALTWNGSVSTSWSTVDNWTPNGSPSDITAVTIPNASTTTFDPIVPLIATCGTMNIESGGILNTMAGSELTINGAVGSWFNMGGTFNPGDGVVIFSNADATMAGSTDFNNVTIDVGATLTLEENTYVGIFGAIINNGIIGKVDKGVTIVEYKGADQIVIVPNSLTNRYHTLILSGTGTKTMPSSALEIVVDFSMAGTTIATLTSSMTVNGNLTIGSGNDLLVSPVGNLTVSGTLTNNAGSAGFVLQSDATGTAALIHNTDNVPATVQRYITGIAEDWHFLSSPVSNQPISGSWLPSGTYGNGTGYDLYLWNEPNSCWIYNLDVTSALNWNMFHPGANFEVGRGYLYSVQALNPTKEFSGYLNNGSIDYRLTIGSTDDGLKGFNLIGNPYPSSINWQAAMGWTRSNLVESGGGYDMWIWNPATSNYGVSNSFTGISTNGITQYIAPMQGFFVQALSDGHLLMDNNLRTFNGASDWLKSSMQNSVNIGVSVISEAGYGSDEAIIGFGYSENENGATKLFSRVPTAPSLYMVSGSENLSVRYLTNTIENPAVPLQFTPGANGNFTINCNFDPFNFETVVLEDRKTHSFHNLKANSEYSFSSSTADNSNRFVLYFGPVNSSSEAGFPAQIYTANYQLVIDLTLVSGNTETYVYDIMGRLLLHKKLQGETLHNLNLNAQTQIVVVTLKNPAGGLTQKVFWNGNR